jgi:hypothetical protein
MNHQTTADANQETDLNDSVAPTPTHVVVAPQLPNGKDVPVQFSGPCANGEQITLQHDQDYDITFQLTGAHGVNSWNGMNPFGNLAGGSCPTTGQGASPPFSVKPGSSATSFTVHMDAQPIGYSTHFRLNFNDGYSRDPIIVVN